MLARGSRQREEAVSSTCGQQTPQRRRVLAFGWGLERAGVPRRRRQHLQRRCACACGRRPCGGPPGIPSFLLGLEHLDHLPLQRQVVVADRLARHPRGPTGAADVVQGLLDRLVHLGRVRLVPGNGRHPLLGKLLPGEGTPAWRGEGSSGPGRRGQEREAEGKRRGRSPTRTPLAGSLYMAAEIAPALLAPSIGARGWLDLAQLHVEQRGPAHRDRELRGRGMEGVGGMEKGTGELAPQSRHSRARGWVKTPT